MSRYLKKASGRKNTEESEKEYYFNNIGLACLKFSYQSQHQGPPQHPQF